MKLERNGKLRISNDTIQRPLQIHINNPPSLSTLLQITILIDEIHIKDRTRFHNPRIRNDNINPPESLNSSLEARRQLLDSRDLSELVTWEISLVYADRMCSPKFHIHTCFTYHIVPLQQRIRIQSLNTSAYKYSVVSLARTAATEMARILHSHILTQL